ncbi:protein ERGIC-53-like isoform X2 [Oryctolagus cuniculus]|uniref:protein ERGIC-53-like isoform X2 n=1 Tax=Oryctolagus cuniculus TaxID=9986 RepID=UPI00387A6D68
MPGTRGPGPSLGLLLLLLLGPAGAAAPRRRFEYKLSFKGPGLAPPGAGMSFWSHHGDAILGLDEVRLAPSLRDRGGAVWSRVPVLLSAWEVEVQLRVTGPGRRGAQGVAVWYTRERGRVGSVLGGPASWDGIGILLDSSAGDTQDSPAIRVLAGDGHSPSTQLGGGASRVLGLCRRDFRNRPYPIRARITYWGQRLRVSSNSGLTPHDPDEVCVEVGPLLLAPGGFFGVSAATSTLADDHDVLAFLTYSLHEPGPEAPPQPLPEAEQLRLARRLEALRATLALGAREDVVPKPDSGERLSDLEESLSRHSRVLQALGGLSEQLAQARRQWKQQLGAPGQVRPEGGWDSAQLSTLLCGQRTLLQALREMRRQQSRPPASPAGAQGSPPACGPASSCSSSSPRLWPSSATSTSDRSWTSAFGSVCPEAAFLRALPHTSRAPWGLSGGSPSPPTRKPDHSPFSLASGQRGVFCVPSSRSHLSGWQAPALLKVIPASPSSDTITDLPGSP